MLSGIGLFDVRSLTTENPAFQIGAPLFDKITIQLPKALRKNKFTIQVKKTDPDSFYVGQIQLNNKPWTSWELPFEQLVKGGVMTLDLKRNIRIN